MKVKETVLGVGAEGTLTKKLFLGKKVVEKKRKPKRYRAKELDEKIRRERTKKEALLLHDARGFGVRTPHVLKVDLDKGIILMEFIEGKVLKECIKGNWKKYCRKLGKKIGLMHKNGLIHGDLTTSNVLVENGGLAFVDFGLGFRSEKTEDKAVDLVNLKKTFAATHPSLPEGWKEIAGAYKANTGKTGEKALRRAEEIRKMARHS